MAGEIHKAPDIFGDIPDVPLDKVLIECNATRVGLQHTGVYGASPDITLDILSSMVGNDIVPPNG